MTLAVADPGWVDLDWTGIVKLCLFRETGNKEDWKGSVTSTPVRDHNCHHVAQNHFSIIDFESVSLSI